MIQAYKQADNNFTIAPFLCYNTVMIRIGTSGWSYKHWKGEFYPKTIPQKKWLEYFTEHFNTVEINSSFYHIPRESVTSGWNSRTPPDFRFAVKMSRLVSHVHRLKNCRDTLDWFFKNMAPLSGKISVYLIQLPPSLCPGRDILSDFLKSLKAKNPQQRYTVEFRNEKCCNQQIIDILKEYSISLCIHDFNMTFSDNLDSLQPFITSDSIYIRFHGYGSRYEGNYPDNLLARFALRIREWNTSGLDVFAYFNNDLKGFAVKNALTLQDFINQGKADLPVNN